MRKCINGLIGLVFVTGFLLTFGEIKEASAGPQISINIPLPPPPPFLFPRPPEVIIVPRSEIVIAPHPEVDVFFYDDYWWSPRGNRWYRSRHYNGPWVIINLRHVPHHLRNIPRDHRTVYEKEPRYPYESHDRWIKERHRERMERREWREQRQERRREIMEDRKENRHGRGHGRGRGND
jgi:hypothetical protein